MKNAWLVLVGVSGMCAILGLSLWLVQRPLLSDWLLHGSSGAPKAAVAVRDSFLAADSDAELSQLLSEFNSVWPEWQLTTAEMSHLVDVWRLVEWLQWVGLVGFGVLLMLGLLAWRRDALVLYFRGLVGAGVFLLLGLVWIGALMFLYWDWFFVVFHQIGFPQGNWAFPLSSHLVALFPEVLWMRFGWLWVGVIALVSAVSIVLGAIESKRR